MNTERIVVTRGARFALGRCVVTRGACQALESTGVDPMYLLSKHQAGDPGTLCAEDVRANADAVRNGGRILSSYLLAGGVTVWIITEWDRSATTILLPEEY